MLAKATYSSQITSDLSGIANSTETSFEDDWVVIATIDGVEMSYLETSLQGEEMIFLKIENNNPTEVTIKWSLWLESEHKSIVVGAHQTIKGEHNYKCPSVLKERIPEGMTAADLNPDITVY